MHHFIFPTQDTWISSGSSKINGESFKDQNFGRDQILEIKKVFYNNSFDYQTRALVDFSGPDFNAMSKSIVDGNISNPTFFLKLFETEGNSELSEEYTLAAYPLYQAWKEGTGKFGDSPKNTNGSSWNNRINPYGGNETTWSFRESMIAIGEAGDEDIDGIEFTEFHVAFGNTSQSFGNVTGSDFLGGAPGEGGGGVYIRRKGYFASQSFDSQSPDVEMNVTDMVNKWLGGNVSNYGLILKISGSQETDSITSGKLKFFSKDTHTIFQPRLEIRWDDSSFSTGNLNELTMSGLADNYLYMRGLREEYKEGERVKFRVGARKRYIQKTFTDSVQKTNSSFIASGSGSYAIKDVATDEYIVPFSTYTNLSVDTEGNYFNQWLDGFYPDRVYRIQLKLKTNDGQEQVFDDDFEFIVKRS